MQDSSSSIQTFSESETQQDLNQQLPVLSSAYHLNAKLNNPSPSLGNDPLSLPLGDSTDGAYTRKWLNQEVTPVLLEGMRYLVRERYVYFVLICKYWDFLILISIMFSIRPTDPIKALAQFLLEKRYTQNSKEEKLAQNQSIQNARVPLLSSSSVQSLSLPKGQSNSDQKPTDQDQLEKAEENQNQSKNEQTNPDDSENKLANQNHSDKQSINHDNLENEPKSLIGSPTNITDQNEVTKDPFDQLQDDASEPATKKRKTDD